MLGSVNLHGRTDLARRVKDGQVAIDFLRPVDLQAATIAAEAGASLFALLPRGLPSVLLGAVTVGMQLPTSPVFYLLGAVSLLLGIVISAATAYLIAVAGFWLVETRGLQILYSPLNRPWPGPVGGRVKRIVSWFDGPLLLSGDLLRRRRADVRPSAAHQHRLRRRPREGPAARPGVRALAVPGTR